MSQDEREYRRAGCRLVSVAILIILVAIWLIPEIMQ